MEIIGKAIPNVDAFLKITGRAVYTKDIRLPGMLIGKILRSPVPHARILNIDTDRARRLLGVKAVITAQDTPKIKLGRIGIPGFFYDKLPIEDKKVRCIGDELAAVAAIDEDTATEALELISMDLEELPAIYDPEEAIREDAVRIHDERESNVSMMREFILGDVDKGFQEADIIFEDEFSTQSQSACCLEVHNVVVNPESSGRLSVWLSTQAPHLVKDSLATVCGIAPDHFNIVKTHVGGSFGSKVNIGSMEPIAVFLARKAGRPVKIENSREEEFFTVNARHPTMSKMKFGFKKDGRITAKQTKIILDNGAYNGTGPAILNFNSIMFSSLYVCRNIKYEGYLVYTNKLANGSLRGFGNPQAMFGHEVMMDIAAERLGIDPKDIRIINANLPHSMAAGIPVTSCGLKETIKEACEKSDWTRKRKICGKGYGIGIACMIHTAAGSNLFGTNYSGASIELDADGSIKVNIGVSDIGQGSNTVLLQIAAEILCVSINDLQFGKADTDNMPFDVGAKGSRTTFCAGFAVMEAAKDIRAQILKVASEILGVVPSDLAMRGKNVFTRHCPEQRISLREIASFAFHRLGKTVVGKGVFRQKGSDSNTHTDKSYEAPALAFGTQIAEVEVDKETGVVKVKRITSAHDLGLVINPLLARGQVIGGVLQGIGFALYEDIIYENGRFMNTTFHDYKVPTTKDSTEIDCFWIETHDPNGPFGSKGLAEASNIPTAPAIANAIHSAVGIRFKNLPITPAKVLQAVRGEFKREKQSVVNKSNLE